MSALTELLELPSVYARELADARAADVPNDAPCMQRFLADYELLKAEIAYLEEKARELIKRYRI